MLWLSMPGLHWRHQHLVDDVNDAVRGRDIGRDDIDADHLAFLHPVGVGEAPVHAKTCVVDEDVDTENLIPPMILQPLVENSIWHGLTNSESLQKNLWISFQEIGDYLKIIVSDNGVGREEAKKHTNLQKKNSISIQNIRDRLEILHPNESKIEISDLNSNNGAVGTKVEITLPF